MKKIFDHIRDHLNEIAPEIDSDSFAARKLSEWSDIFERLMRNRLLMGSLRYFKLNDSRMPGHTNMIIKMISDRLAIYNETGNKEMLVDIANLCLVEFTHSDHPKCHFRALNTNEKGEKV